MNRNDFFQFLIDGFFDGAFLYSLLFFIIATMAYSIAAAFVADVKSRKNGA